MAIAAKEVNTGLRMSWEEFLEWDNEGFAEWVDGEVVILSSLSLIHARIARFLFQCLSYFVNSRESGEVFFEGYLMRMAHLRRARLPDILFIAKGSLVPLENQYLDGPADLAVEVVSPDSTRRDRREKFEEYEAAGVREYWLIDVPRKEAKFFILNVSGKYQSADLGEDSIFRSSVLKGFWMDPNWLWQSPLPNPLSISKLWESSAS